MMMDDDVAARWKKAQDDLSDALCDIPGFDPKLEQRCIAYLATIPNVTERAKVGNALFGKRCSSILDGI